MYVGIFLYVYINLFFIACSITGSNTTCFNTNTLLNNTYAAHYIL
jgi:hypothetical protein